MSKYYPELDERLFRAVTAAGLRVVVCPKPGFARKFACLAVDFGAIHTRCTAGGASAEFPIGTAHFLEHCVFDSPQCDYAAAFAARGAEVNAFTSYDMTAYYFSCTERLGENLALLLRMVTAGEFDAHCVEKERAVIAQEIAMTADEPESRVYENLLRTLYAVHPIREPILGTRASIDTINERTLCAAHGAFYRPENMVLCVVGDTPADEVLRIAEATRSPCAPRGEAVRSWQEPPRTGRMLVRDEMDLPMPTFRLAFPCDAPPRGEAAARAEIVGDLAAEALFGEGSALYRTLYEQGVIDSSFGGGFETVEGCAMLTCAGDSAQPERVRDAVYEAIERLAREGIDAAEFERLRRSAVGQRIRALDRVDAVGVRLCTYELDGVDDFRFPQLYRQVECAQIAAFAADLARRAHCVLSVVYPKEASYESE